MKKASRLDVLPNEQAELEPTPMAPGKQTLVSMVQMRATGPAKPSETTPQGSQPFLGPLSSSFEGGGAPLLNQMGAAFGEDFSSVQIHQNSDAADVGARAYTRGEGIHFASGEFAPETEEGRALLGHELAHVVQQRHGRVTATREKAGVPVNDEEALEAEADRAGAAAARGQRVTLSAKSNGPSAGPVAIQRAADENELGECPDPAAGGAGPTAADPRSGTDWTSIMGHPGWGFARAGLEITRFVPIAGMFGGMAADTIEGAQNLATGGQTDNEWMELGLMVRQAVVFVNNVMGHVLYLGELCQDAAIASVLGVELEVVVAPADEALATFKAVLQGTQTLADLAILAGACVGVDNAVVGSEEWEAYKSIAEGFVVDSVLDGVGLLTAAADVATFGLANGEAVKTTAKSAFSFVSLGKQILENIWDVGGSWLSIWGGDFVAESNKAPAQQESAEGLSAAEAGPLMLGELDLMDAVHQEGGALIDSGGEKIDGMLAGLREFQAGALEGREPFEMIQNALVEGLENFEGRLTALSEAEVLATSAELETDRLLANLSTAEAAINRLAVPTLALPEHTELGDNPVADTIEQGIDKGAEIGNMGLAEVEAQLQAAIDRVKQSFIAELQPQREQLEVAAQFIATFKGLVAEQLEFVRDSTAKLKEAVANAQEPIDVIDALIAEVADMLGLEGELDLSALQAEWARAGSYLADLRGWASSLA